MCRQCNGDIGNPHPGLGLRRFALVDMGEELDLQGREFELICRLPAKMIPKRQGLGFRVRNP